MTGVLTILTMAERAGIVLSVDNDRLVVDAPRGAVSPAFRADLAQQKPALIAVLWRLQAMRRLAAQAPRPVVYARPEARGGPGHCFSCGDPLEQPDAYGRCLPCDLAADRYHATAATTGGVNASEVA